MHTPDLSAMLRWPNVPACYGWLSLDRRGQWRMRGEPVMHQGLTAFLNRQYGCDEHGNYFVQNGPQRVFVELDYTPWILHLTAEGRLETHTGELAEEVRSAAFDEEGNLLLEIPFGIALLCDRDLPALLGCLRQANGEAADETALLELLGLASGTISQLSFAWGGHQLPILSLRRSELARRFGFVASPQPEKPAPTE